MTRRLTIAMGLALILLGAERSSFGQPPGMGPHAEIACGACHVLGADGEPFVPVLLVESQELLCGSSCHDAALGLTHDGSHPMGFVPRYALPAGFPLDEHGRMSCGSCHRVHATTPRLLRGDGGSDPCTPCHAE